jgi:hypothetical protein
MKNFNADNEPRISPGFKVPKGYFEDFSSRVMDRLPERGPKVIPIHSNRRWLYVAAAILVLALSLPLLNRITSNSTVTDQAAVENYIALHSEISDEDIVELLEFEDISKIDIEYQLEDKTVEDILSSGNNLENIIN